MASLLGLLHMGAASLGAQQSGIAITGNNISNAQTPGFARRDLRIDEGRGVFSGGSVAAGVLRSEDFVLSEKIALQQGELQNRTLLASGLRQVEQVLQTGQSNLSQKVAGLASALSQLGPAPADPVRRTDVIEKGRSVAAEFNRIAFSLGRLVEQNGAEAQSRLTKINDLAQQLAALNRKTMAGAGGVTAPDGAPLARLKDQRDEVARTLSGLVGGQVLQNSDGSIDLLVGGLSLVHGATAQTLDVQPSGGALAVTIGGALVQQAVSGELGATLTARDAAKQTLEQFDRLAYDFSAALNAQHAFGVGLDGNGARPFFQRLAGPTGAALSLKLDPGLTTQTLAAGFTAQPGDNRNAVALANLIDQPVLEGGRSSFSNVYGRVAAQLGAGVQRAEGDLVTAEEQAAALDKARDASMGVSTDEETARLLAYQRGFEASARFIKTIDELSAQLLAMFSS